MLQKNFEFILTKAKIYENWWNFMNLSFNLAFLKSELTAIDKYSSLLRYGINRGCRRFKKYKLKGENYF